MKADITCWCCGLPLAATREIMPHERAALAREMWRMRVVGWALGSVSPLFFLVSLAVAASGDLAQVPSVVILICSLGFTSVGVVIANQSLVRAGGIRADLRQGQWLRFEGLYRLQEDADNPSSASRMLAQHLGQPICLDVLSASHRLWRIDDKPLRKWTTISLTETADQPEVAEIAAQWLDPAGEVDGLDLASGRRELSAAEKDEIRQIARKSWHGPLMPTLLLVPWASVLCIYAINTGAPMPRGWDGIMFILLLLFALAALYRQYKGIRRAVQLHKDRREGIVVIISGTEIVEGTTQPETALVEMLPHTNLPWTVQGEPSNWRHCG